eukprot:4524383-Pyramimonas_sp.AAC.1
MDRCAAPRRGSPTTPATASEEPTATMGGYDIRRDGGLVNCASAASYCAPPSSSHASASARRPPWSWSTPPQSTTSGAQHAAGYYQN